MKLDAALVVKTVKVWGIIFPGNRTEEELAVVAAMYHKAFQGVFDNNTFRIACDLVVKETEFFPTIASVLKVRDYAYQKSQAQLNPSDNLRLEEETGNLTPEEIEINLEKIKIITDLICGKITQEEAGRRQDELVTYSV
jgi:phosphoenolpyruvate carboxylase